LSIIEKEGHMTVMKTTRLALGITYILIVAASVSAQAPSLSGTWKLNAAQSDYGADTPPKSFTVTLAIQEPTLHLAVAAVTSDDREQKYTMELTTDGKPVMSKGRRNSSDSARWDGPTLVLEHNEQNYTFIRRIAVSADGNTATSKNVFKITDGQDVVTTEVFDRQP
jgi:hypothetical protein